MKPQPIPTKLEHRLPRSAAIMLCAVITCVPASNVSALGDAAEQRGSGATASGDGSTAVGRNATSTATATHPYSTAIGEGVEAKGDYSTSIGKVDAIGQKNTAEGNFSLSIGVANYAKGLGSFAFGAENDAYGDYSTVFGYGTAAPSYGQFVLGRFNIIQQSPVPNATGWNNADDLFVIGNGNGVANDPHQYNNAFKVQKNGDAMVGGNLAVSGTVTSGGQTLLTLDQAANNYVSAGSDTLMIGPNTMSLPQSAAIGISAYAQSTNSLAIGFGNFAGADQSIAIGYAAGAGSYSYGGFTSDVAVGSSVSTDGYSNFATAMGVMSHTGSSYATAVGYGDNAGGIGASAFGFQNNAIGDYSATLGNNLNAIGYSQVVVGRFNKVTAQNPSGWDANDELFVVANGESMASTKNALVVKKSGDTTINGSLSVTGNIVVPEHGDISMGEFTAHQ